MANSGHDAGFVLLIERGVTRFPRRPILGDRFLIGAGSNCHLQLAGEMPILHSIVIPEGDHLWIDAVVPSPELAVNGQIVRESELRKGDLIEIGQFVLSVEQNIPATSHAVAAPHSAAKLVSALERELELQTDDLTRRREGAAALLQAARTKIATPAAPFSVDPQTAVLENILKELKLREEKLDHREATLKEYARQLEETQRALKEQLEKAADQEANPSDGTTSLRLTA